MRIRALLRRSGSVPQSSTLPEILHAGEITLIPENLQAKVKERIVKLTPTEFEILHCLMQHHGQTVSTGKLWKRSGAILQTTTWIQSACIFDICAQDWNSRSQIHQNRIRWRLSAHCRRLRKSRWRKLATISSANISVPSQKCHSEPIDRGYAD